MYFDLKNKTKKKHKNNKISKQISLNCQDYSRAKVLFPHPPTCYLPHLPNQSQDCCSRLVSGEQPNLQKLQISCILFLRLQIILLHLETLEQTGEFTRNQPIVISWHQLINPESQGAYLKQVFSQ